MSRLRPVFVALAAAAFYAILSVGCYGRGGSPCRSNGDCRHGFVCCSTGICHSSCPTGTDAGARDASTDAATDAARDAATDASADAATDASADAEVDAALDASADAGDGG